MDSQELLLVPGHCEHQKVVIGEARELLKIASKVRQCIGKDWSERDQHGLDRRIDADLATIAAIECGKPLVQEAAATLGADVAIIEFWLPKLGLSKVQRRRLRRVAEGVTHLLDHAESERDPVEQLREELPEIVQNLSHKG